MRRALELAERGRGFVEPNPVVGCVVATGDRLLAEGWHQRFGGPHAEVHALADLADVDLSRCTVYVTLEPCCHHGKTPPCTDLLLARRPGRAVVAMTDPFPAVAGRGLELLRQAGIAVESGLLEAEARRRNEPFLTLVTKDRPMVHAKWAMSADGRVATATGDSKWITGEPSRAHAHRFRGLVDGIVIGAGTALADQPILTARPPGPRVATRIVLDSQLRLPVDSPLVSTITQAPLLVVTGPDALADRERALTGAGAEVLRVPADARGRPDPVALLSLLGQRRMTNLLLEGGSAVLGSFADADRIDAVRLYLAPNVLGGATALGPVGGEGRDRVRLASRFERTAVTPIGPDLFVELRRG
jgi:diaminohydroxyphosphoribosylaminopyrimidine deaminase/5-amino-6-(5-phosphoribosylamino)uracil reductase